jgi:hypothetical protein
VSAVTLTALLLGSTSPKSEERTLLLSLVSDLETMEAKHNLINRRYALVFLTHWRISVAIPKPQKFQIGRSCPCPSWVVPPGPSSRQASSAAVHFTLVP